MADQFRRASRGGRGCTSSIIIVLAIVALSIWLFSSIIGRAFSWGQANEPAAQTQDGGVLIGGANDPGQQLPALNRIVTALDVDSEGCATDTTDEFFADEPIFVVVPQSLIPSGTELFVRLYDQRGPVEDTDPLRADQQMETCVWFVFEPEQSGFAPGRYQAELFINGQSADRIDFAIAEGSAGFSSDSGGTSGVGGGIERVLASFELDEDGCVAAAEERFRPSDTIYVSAGPAFIPQGTRLEARLLRTGRLLEEADPLTAPEDMETCVYFAFEAPGGGFDAGEYAAEIYVDGSLAGDAQFAVR